MMKKLLILLIFLVIQVSLSWAQKAGGQAGAFLRRGADSRALSLGSAYTSVTDGASSVYWNPAGLNDIQGHEFNVMYSTLTLDRKEYFVAYGVSVKGLFSFGVGFYRFGVDNIDGRDNQGNQTKNFSDSENSIMLSATKEFVVSENWRFSLGATGKYLNHSLQDFSAKGFGLDLGVIATITQLVRVGIVFQDISSSLKWNTESGVKENIPLTIRLGASVYPDFFPMALSVELVKVANIDPVFKVGIGSQLIKHFGVKLGYDGNKPTFGAFLWYPIDVLTVQFDYAATHDILENSYIHHLGLTLKF